jgi:bifunctional DNase/RNase
MIEVKVDTIRARLTGHERLILLREIGEERQLPIYIGVPEAEAISLELRGYKHARPLTHDLLTNCIAALGGELQYVYINELRDDVFHARLHILHNGRELDIDARSSDSIAIAVRAQVPIYVADAVMDKAGAWPSEEVEEVDATKLEVFRDFVDTLDLDNLGAEIDSAEDDEAEEE